MNGNNNVKAKNAKNLYKLSKLETGKKEEKKIEEIIPKFPITLRSSLLLEEEKNKQPKKIFETSIDELIKNRLNLLSKKEYNDETRTNIKDYGSFSAYVENENERLRMYNFKINVKFDNFEFKPLEEIENENPIDEPEEIKIDKTSGYNNTNTHNKNTNNKNKTSNSTSNKNTSNNNISRKNSRKSSQKRNTEKSKELESESVQSKSVTPSEASKIKKVSDDVVDELFNKYTKKDE